MEAGVWGGSVMDVTGGLVDVVSRSGNLVAIGAIVFVGAAAFLGVGQHSTAQFLDPHAWLHAVIHLLKGL
jgi:hypothetical protein